MTFLVEVWPLLALVLCSATLASITPVRVYTRSTPTTANNLLNLSVGIYSFAPAAYSSTAQSLVDVE